MVIQNDNLRTLGINIFISLEEQGMTLADGCI